MCAVSTAGLVAESCPSPKQNAFTRIVCEMCATEIDCSTVHWRSWTCVRSVPQCSTWVKGAVTSARCFVFNNGFLKVISPLMGIGLIITHHWLEFADESRAKMLDMLGRGHLNQSCYSPALSLEHSSALLDGSGTMGNEMRAVILILAC